MKKLLIQPLPHRAFNFCSAVILWGGMGVLCFLISFAAIATVMDPGPKARGVVPPAAFPAPEAHCYKGKWFKDSHTQKWFQEEHCFQESLDQVRELPRLLPNPDVEGP